MANWFFGGNNDEIENSLDVESEDLTKPEFWERLGITPIVVDKSDPNYIEKMGDEVCKIIEIVAKELKNDQK